MVHRVIYGLVWVLSILGMGSTSSGTVWENLTHGLPVLNPNCLRSNRKERHQIVQCRPAFQVVAHTYINVSVSNNNNFITSTARNDNMNLRLDHCLIASYDRPLLPPFTFNSILAESHWRLQPLRRAISDQRKCRRLSNILAFWGTNHHNRYHYSTRPFSYFPQSHQQLNNSTQIITCGPTETVTPEHDTISCWSKDLYIGFNTGIPWVGFS